MPDSTIYKVLFINQGQVYEVYTRRVHPGSLMGFVEIEELVFGERSKLLVDPAEEKLRGEFKGVKRSYLPMHAVIRIDEMARQGPARIHDLPKGTSGTVTAFPGAVLPPGLKPGGDSDS